MKQICLMLTLFFISSCQKKESTSNSLAQKGRTVYFANCIACHNPNPKLPGAIGPDVYGSSKELLTARVLYRNYPPAYKPKRQSHLMPDLSHLKNDIEALTAFLNQ